MKEDGKEGEGEGKQAFPLERNRLCMHCDQTRCSQKSSQRTTLWVWNQSTP